MKTRLLMMDKCFYLLCVCVLICTAFACQSLPKEALDPPLTDTLKQKISKARNAIDETRQALMRAQNSPYSQELMIRLAELMSDEARAHYQVARAREGVSDKALHVPQVSTLKQNAIILYQEFTKNFPQSPLAARAWFNQGQEYRELGKYEEMRSTFESLNEKFPEHPLSLEALMVLGGDHFDRAQLDKAAERFQKVTQAKLHRMSGLASYKLAWVYVNQDKCPKAIEAFQHAIIKLNEWFKGSGKKEYQEGLYSELDVRREALSDMMFCFSKEKKYEGKAVKTIQKLAHDRSSLVAALEKLSKRYALLGPQGKDRSQAVVNPKSKDMRDVSRTLLDFAPASDRRLDDAQTLHASLLQLKDYQQVGDDVRRISDMIRRSISEPQLAEAEREQLLNEFERYVRDLATKAQEHLLGKTATKKSIIWNAKSQQIAQAYHVYLDTFTQNDNRIDMMDNLASFYALADQNLQAGRSFYDLVLTLQKQKSDPKNAQKAKSLHNYAYQSVIRFQKALAENGRTQSERVVARAALRKAASQLLVTRLSNKQAPQVQLAIAQTFYDEGRLDQAIEYLSAVALEHPKTEQGDVAALLILDAYKQKNDFLGLAYAGERLMKVGVSQSLQGRIKNLVAQAKQKELDELALEAAGVDGSDVTGELIEFASASGTSSLGERALLNAFVAARASGDLNAMRRVADLMTKEYSKSKQLLGVFTSLARSSAEQLDIEGAEVTFKKAAKMSSGQKVSLLSKLALLKSNLGDIEGALAELNSVLKDVDPSSEKGWALYADLLIRFKGSKEAWKVISPFKDSGDVNLSAALGYLYMTQKKYDDAEEMLDQAMSDETKLLPTFKALALFSLAEVYTNFLKDFTPGDSIDDLAEWVTMMELAEQSYLKAARTAQPLWGSFALNRLAALSQYTSKTIASFKAPSSLTSQQKKTYQTGFQKRSAALSKQSQQALKACKELAWKRGLFTAPIRACLGDQILNSPILEPTEYKARTATSKPKLGKAEKKALAQNSQDSKAAVRLALLLLNSNDAHLARLVLSQVLQGGGAEVFNLYGVACARIDDWSGALEGFARAAIAGLEVGQRNAKKALKKLNLAKAAQEASKFWNAQGSATGPGGILW